MSETPDRAPSGKSRTSGDPRPYVILVGLCLFTVGCGDNIFPGLVNAVANVLSSDAPLSPVDSVDVPGVGADSQSPGANGVVPVNGGTGSDTHTPNTTGSGNSTLAQGTSSPPTFNPGNIFGPVTFVQGPTNVFTPSGPTVAPQVPPQTSFTGPPPATTPPATTPPATTSTGAPGLTTAQGDALKAQEQQCLKECVEDPMIEKCPSGGVQSCDDVASAKGISRGQPFSPDMGG